MGAAWDVFSRARSIAGFRVTYKYSWVYLHVHAFIAGLKVIYEYKWRPTGAYLHIRTVADLG